MFFFGASQFCVNASRFFVVVVRVFSVRIFLQNPRSQMVLVDAFDGELICEYGVQEQGEECRLEVSKETRIFQKRTGPCNC